MPDTRIDPETGYVSVLCDGCGYPDDRCHCDEPDYEDEAKREEDIE